METACLRIKFTPLVQKNHKDNSKCCLEIVPEVSCIQNLDKLTWRKETDFIEYTIPMTYKVILKKRQAIQDASDEVVKTYHSCVDLLLPSSKSGLNPGSCDVSKIISDTFIFCKSFDNGSSKEKVMSSYIHERKPSDLVYNYPVSHKTTNTSLKTFDREPKEDIEILEDGEVNVRSNVQQNIENVSLENVSLAKITNTKDNYNSVILDKVSLTEFTNTDKQYVILNETVQVGNTVLHAEKKSTIPDSKQRLSLSPICSLNTEETPIVNKIVASKAVTCKIYDSQKDLVPLGIINTPSWTSNALSTIIDESGQNLPQRFKSKCRDPPEIRVAEYLQYMEREILPLKMMLDEILSKCSALGIKLGSKTSSKQSLMYKTVSMYSYSYRPSPETVKSKDIIQSNRVVYSIVFNG